MTLHVSESEHTTAREFFLRLRSVAERVGWQVPETSWPTISRIAQDRLGRNFARVDDGLLRATLDGIRGTHSHLFATTPDIALFGNLQSPTESP